jgi:hypothetical protein
LPSWEQAQEQLGESVSSMFADFLRERVAKLSPEENRIINPFFFNDHGKPRSCQAGTRSSKYAEQ